MVSHTAPEATYHRCHRRLRRCNHQPPVSPSTFLPSHVFILLLPSPRPLLHAGACRVRVVELWGRTHAAERGHGSQHRPSRNLTAKHHCKKQPRTRPCPASALRFTFSYPSPHRWPNLRPNTSRLLTAPPAMAGHVGGERPLGNPILPRAVGLACCGMGAGSSVDNWCDRDA